MKTRTVPSQTFRVAALLKTCGIGVKLAVWKSMQDGIVHVDAEYLDKFLYKPEHLCAEDAKGNVLNDPQMRVLYVTVRWLSDEDVRLASYGQVKTDAVNKPRYKTFHRDGLYSQRIFGPCRWFSCECGRYRKRRFEGIVCDRCGTEVCDFIVRNYRFGHIELPETVLHPYSGKPIGVLPVLPAGLRESDTSLYGLNYHYTQIIRCCNGELKRSLQGYVDPLYYTLPKVGMSLYDALLLEKQHGGVLANCPFGEMIELANTGKRYPLDLTRIEDLL